MAKAGPPTAVRLIVPAGMSRRQLMKLGWLLGAAAVAPPLLTRRQPLLVAPATDLILDSGTEPGDLRRPTKPG